MDTLSLKIDDQDMLTFELFINDQPLADLLNDGNKGIPSWIIDNKLPTWPPHQPESEFTIVTVCDCGEYGCGHSRCRLKEESDQVIFYDFQGDTGTRGKTITFTVSRNSYDQVIAEINARMRRLQTEA